jgi:Fe2+ or Zn2+ uptake regulation protein
MSTNNAKEKRLLLSKRIRPTFQRLAVLKYLVEHKTHPNVEDIYAQLVKSIPTMSRTTIYNTLKSFIKAGLVKPILISETETRYDGTVDPHHHFLCEKCGRISDVLIECRQFKAGKVMGNVINEVHGYFKGICKNCQ